MEIEHVAYALVQVAHNFGAAAVIGSPACVLYVRPAVEAECRLARLTLLGWIVQAVSGAAFGAVGFYYLWGVSRPAGDRPGRARGQDRLRRLGDRSRARLSPPPVAEGVRWRAWRLEAALGVTALCVAAVLRWFS